jgi:bacillithiol biosynthesis cysteine-adding enzyme BshC
VSDAATSATAARLPVDVRRLPWIRRLAADYACSFEPLAPFYAGNPADPAAWRAAIDRAQRPSRPRADIAAALVRQQEQHGAPPGAVLSARLLADERTVVAATGQQAGLFGGPLYTLLKAITAIKLAADIRARWHVPAVPLFWVESEDHDWNEVAACPVLDGDMQRRAITLAARPGAGTNPVGSILLGQEVAATLDALEQTMAATEFTPGLLGALRETYRPDESVAGAFIRWMLRLLGEHGLVVYDASDPAMKAYVAPLFLRELEEPGETARGASEAGRRLAALGYHAQAEPDERSVALFHLDGERRAIHLDGRDLLIGHSSRRPATEVLAELRQHPESFSPNVLLRPLVQDTLFPTVAYVAGPNELAYLGQLRGVYERFGTPMPLMVPRSSATLLDSAAMKFVLRHDVRFEALAHNDEAALNRLLEQHLPPSVEQAWLEAEAGVAGRMEALIAQVPLVDPTLEGAARSALGRMTHDLETLRAKIIHAAKRRDETLRRQFARTRALAFPGDEPQERALGFVYFLNRYGPALVERLMAELPVDAVHHWLLSI